MADDHWNEQLEKSRVGIQPIHFLLGSWAGSGACDGKPVSGKMRVRTLFDGSWIEAVEELLDSENEIIHSDVSLYRFDAQNDCIEVIQLAAGGHRMLSSVEILEEGFRWITGPGAPQLRFWNTSEGFRYTVTLPEDGEAAIDMVYLPS